MKKIKTSKLVSLFCLLSLFQLWAFSAQAQDEGSAMEDFMEQELENMRKRFEAFDNQIDKLNGNSGRFNFSFGGSLPNNIITDKEWIETEHEKIFRVKINAPKDSPIDIQVDAEKITLSGKVVREQKQQKSISQFSDITAVPSDVKGQEAKIEQKDHVLQITFPKKDSAKKAKTTSPIKIDQKVPVQLNGDVI